MIVKIQQTHAATITGPRSLRGVASVAGVGHTDWSADYERSRQGLQGPDSYGLGALAFRRALDDAGLTREDIDGLIVGPKTAYERMGEVLGLNTRWGGQADSVQAVVQACMAIHSGLAEVVALVYGYDQRSSKVQYGGAGTVSGGADHLSYVYHSPWGLTSQGALYALMFQRYKELYGMTERELGAVAVAQRLGASLNPHAVMPKRITIDEYLAAPYVCQPLRLLDYCLINDGGVCLIIAESSRAKKMAKKPVPILGVGRHDLNDAATSLEPRLLHFYRPAQRVAAEQVYGMAGVGPEDMDSVQVYDSFSCHVPFALEGFGYCGEGEAAKFFAEKGIGLDGKLPVNTGGGHISESYMQGWNHQVEAVRQLRGECGLRQVKDCRHVQYCSDVAGKAISIIYGGEA
jgi:acetyl-CoA acetyltransferase